MTLIDEAQARIDAASPALVAELRAMSPADRAARLLVHAETAEDARIVGNVARFRVSSERSGLIAAVDFMVRVEAGS